MTRLAALSLVLMVAASGCSDLGAVPTKAGSRADPIVLRVATDDPSGRLTGAMIEEFAQQVADRGDGSMIVRSDYRSDIGSATAWDQRVARLVTGGEVEMGLIPSRAWDTEGVTSLRALNAPFLVTNDALLNAVVASDLARELMAGLSSVRVTGLALFPEGLRHPFAFSNPLLGPEDYEGAVLRAPTSTTTQAVLESLGARITDQDPNPATQAGLESSYTVAGVDTRTATATGNVTFFPKVEVLVINDDVFAALTDEQRNVLREAATAARDATIATATADAQLAAAYCTSGGRVVLADAEQITSLEAATAPVYRTLEADNATRDLITQIRALKTAHPDGPAPEPCGAPDPTPTPTPGSKTDQNLLNGVYRFEVTDAQLSANGAHMLAEWNEQHGVYTWTLKGGNYCWVAKADNQQRNPDDCGTYTLDGHTIDFTLPGGAHETWTFTTNKNGDIQLAPIKILDKFSVPLMSANRWVKVKEAP